jgi:hypothetical protein
VDHTTLLAGDGAARREYGAENRRSGSWLIKLTTPRAQLSACALAVALCLPTLFVGLQLDDYPLVLRMKRPDLDRWSGSAPFDLFRWFDAAHIRRLTDGLGLPWWTYQDGRCAFFRPLASLTHAFDYALFAQSALPMHLHNLLWFALLLWLAARTYHALVGDRVTAGLATVMFALDSSHGITVSWISNRNGLIAGTMSLASLLCHQRARTRGSRWHALAAWLCFTLALLSSELAVGVVGYLLAYTLFVDGAAPARRVLVLAPYVIMTVGFAWLHHYGGYGSYGLGAYLDPIAEPRDFVTIAPLRWLVLIAAQTGRVSADVYSMSGPRAGSLLLPLIVIVVVLTLLFVWPSLRRHATARCLALGAGLSALPVTAAIPSDRLLVLVGFGVMPVLACAMREALCPVDGVRLPRAFWSGAWRAYLAAGLAFGHILLDPLALPISSLTLAFHNQRIAAAAASVPSDASVSDRVLIVAGVPESFLLTHLATTRDLNGMPRPEKLYWMYSRSAEAHIERISDKTLRVSVPAGMYDGRSEARGPRFPLKAGDRIALSEMTVDVLQVNREGKPSVCDFVFARPLESTKYRWQTWQDGQFREFQVPVQGHAMTLFTKYM